GSTSACLSPPCALSGSSGQPAHAIRRSASRPFCTTTGRGWRCCWGSSSTTHSKPADSTPAPLSIQLVGTDIDGGGQVQRLDGATAGNGERLGTERGQLLAGHAARLVAEQVTVEGLEVGRLQAIAMHVQAGDTLETPGQRVQLHIKLQRCMENRPH